MLSVTDSTAAFHYISTQDHSSATTIWGIIHLAISPKPKSRGVDQIDFYDAVFLSTTNDAALQRAAYPDVE